MRINFIFLEHSFVDEETLVNTINQNISASVYLGGVIFTNLSLESNITYKIRLSASLRNSGRGYYLIKFIYLII